ncbi:hypothetical protein GCM10009623_12390 [Nocardioides aestuarii]|uniref:Uncharacterized protein n=1 Tax=Nocardioides aestuarii TaxID=252231 RepID=A0ABW4TJ32_9ACTN
MRLRFVLPPGWVGFPLHDAPACEREVQRAVRALPLDDGQGARMRRELRDDLLAQCDRARDSGATYLAIAGPRSAPLSGSLVVTPTRHRVAEDSPAWDEVVGVDADRFTLPVGRVARTVRTRQPAVGERSDDLASLAVDYWVIVDGDRLVHVACSTPLVEHDEAMTQLFDAVMGSAVVAEQDPADEHA